MVIQKGNKEVTERKDHVGVDEQAGLHCAIPQTPGRIVSVPEFQEAFLSAKNKGQKLRAALRTLASLGYGADGFWGNPAVTEFIEDYKK